MQGECALIVDDEPVFRSLVRSWLEEFGLMVFEAEHPQEADQRLKERMFSLLLCDWRLPQEDGLSFIRRLGLKGAQGAQRPEVIFMSAHSDTEAALVAVESGAVDFLAKPFSKAELMFRAHKALNERALRERLKIYEDRVSGVERLLPWQGMLGQSRLMRELFSVIERVADTSSTVLITGESGTGKELIAQALHDRSDRAKGPFVTVNCAALPEPLIESELFGHVKGAFTHALESREGLFVQASGGTLFLDEIGELPLSAQAKLLRALQEREVRPIGAGRAVPVDVRVISATHSELSAEVEARRFRADLFYRLNVILIHAPPLRARPEDLQLLIAAMVERACEKLGRERPKLSSEALELLTAHSWPGNVRELESCIESAVALSQGGAIGVEELPESLTLTQAQREERYADHLEPHQLRPLSAESSSKPKSLSIKQHSQRLERSLILKALKESDGVKSRAAERLEISSKTLTYKMKDYGIESGP
jgi:two-component system response regulator AtoC